MPIRYKTTYIAAPASQGCWEPPIYFLNLNLTFLDPLTAKEYTWWAILVQHNFFLDHTKRD